MEGGRSGGLKIPKHPTYIRDIALFSVFKTFYEERINFLSTKRAKD
jgi:hypothetical protein